MNLKTDIVGSNATYSYSFSFTEKYICIKYLTTKFIVYEDFSNSFTSIYNMIC